MLRATKVACSHLLTCTRQGRTLGPPRLLSSTGPGPVAPASQTLRRRSASGETLRRTAQARLLVRADASARRAESSVAESEEKVGHEEVPEELRHGKGDAAAPVVSVTPARQWRGVRLLALLALAVCCSGLMASAAWAGSIGSSSLGHKVASYLRGSHWPDEMIVFVIAAMPVLELRGAIPVGWWMQLDPVVLSVAAIAGNMVPVPFILLYLGRLAEFLKARSQTASSFFDWLFSYTRKKMGPIEEFKWLGLMLFVAVPLPGTGAWSGAIAAYILGMPFWDALWANFFGVVLAGILVNILCTLGLKEAAFLGLILFMISTFVWSFLRFIQKTLGRGNT